MATVLSVDNEETLAWVEQSLKQARHQEQARLTGLLEAVQAEVAFELKLLEAERVSCAGLAQCEPGLRRGKSGALLMSPAPFEQTAYLPWCDISWGAGVTKHLFVSVRRT